MSDFAATLLKIRPDGLRSGPVEAIQVNIGRRCNLACRHCHLECSPGRAESMPWEIMEKVIQIAHESTYRLVDITGGSPELHPHFRKFVEALCKRDQSLQVRTNLVSLVEPGMEGTAEFLRDHGVSLVGSLPCYLEENVDRQRGPGVYRKSITALRMLNSLGYGRDEKWVLNLVHNPGGPFLPARQTDLEEEYRRELRVHLGITFNKLLVLANVPIGRFRRELLDDGKFGEYAGRLRDRFNPANVAGVMCRHQISIDWDGRLYDCDFNLALGITVSHGMPSRVEAFDRQRFDFREIATGDHCFACTAGQGSSCRGSLEALGVEPRRCSDPSLTTPRDR